MAFDDVNGKFDDIFVDKDDDVFSPRDNFFYF